MDKRQQLQQLVWSDPLHFIACGFGSGLIKPAPGTWGTLMAIPFYFLFNHWHWLSYGALVFVAIIFGIYLCGRTAKALDVKDPPEAVWDEIACFWLALWFVPPGWIWLAITFGLFRFFDIIKPWPISWVNDHVKGGLGIMLDDVLAALATLFVVQVLVFIT